MHLVETFNDIVFKQNVLNNPHVYYTDDLCFKVIVSDFVGNKRFISIAHNPCTSEPPTTDLCQRFLTELGFKHVSCVGDVGIKLNPGVMRFMES